MDPLYLYPSDDISVDDISFDDKPLAFAGRCSALFFAASVLPPLPKVRSAIMYAPDHPSSMIVYKTDLMSLTLDRV